MNQGIAGSGVANDGKRFGVVCDAIGIVIYLSIVSHVFIPVMLLLIFITVQL
jgi:hypothetical protein